MGQTLERLFEKMTPDERAEVETFAAFVIARRKLRSEHIVTDEIPTAELLQLVEDSGAFDWLGEPEQDVYSIQDGGPVRWPA